MLGPRPAPCLAPLPLLPCPGWTAILISMSITPAHVFIFWPHVGSSIINVKSWLACFYVQTVSYKWLPTAYFILQIAVWLCTVLACSPVVTPRLSSSILLSRVCSWMCVCVCVCVSVCLCVWSVAHSCPALCDLTDCRPAGSSVHGISQARVLEWVASSFSRGFS